MVIIGSATALLATPRIVAIVVQNRPMAALSRIDHVRHGIDKFDVYVNFATYSGMSGVCATCASRPTAADMKQMHAMSLETDLVIFALTLQIKCAFTEAATVAAGDRQVNR